MHKTWLIYWYMECINLVCHWDTSQVMHEMCRYLWYMIGLSETCWVGMGEMQMDGDHKFFYSGDDNMHAMGVSFLVHKDTISMILGF